MLKGGGEGTVERESLTDGEGIDGAELNGKSYAVYELFNPALAGDSFAQAEFNAENLDRLTIELDFTKDFPDVFISASREGCLPQADGSLPNAKKILDISDYSETASVTIDNNNGDGTPSSSWSIENYYNGAWNEEGKLYIVVKQDGEDQVSEILSLKAYVTLKDDCQCRISGNVQNIDGDGIPGAAVKVWESCLDEPFLTISTKASSWWNVFVQDGDYDIIVPAYNGQGQYYQYHMAAEKGGEYFASSDCGNSSIVSPQNGLNKTTDFTLNGQIDFFVDSPTVSHQGDNNIIATTSQSITIQGSVDLSDSFAQPASLVIHGWNDQVLEIGTYSESGHYSWSHALPVMDLIGTYTFTLTLEDTAGHIISSDYDVVKLDSAGSPSPILSLETVDEFGNIIAW